MNRPIVTPAEAHDATSATAAAGSIVGAPPEAERFGTFIGVYTPSVLTILGLIMYLRFGWVVGNAGLGLTLVIVLLSCAIAFLTALSASAIATNMRVGVGGEYYMISHSLGLELGGAIGIPLFLCRTLSITFYCFGLAESLMFLWPVEAWGTPPDWTVQAIAAGSVVLVTAVAGRSAAVTLKLQVPILVMVGLSVVAFVAGIAGSPRQAPVWEPAYITADGFWMVFAVFFPAVTGFAAGIGMSGDLEDPRRSIPSGTIWSVVTGAGVYLLVPVLLAMILVPRETLAEPGLGLWLTVAFLGPWLIYPGIWGAVLSSAFGSALGGPRVLQALAQDGLAPRFLARLSKTGQPTVATWTSGAIALAAVLLGGLNAVATLVTVLFLTLYLMINLAAAIEELTGDPSYRPTIKVPWQASLLGAVGAVSVMFLISPVACLVAAVLEGAIWIYLRRRSIEKRWGDVRAGLWLALARAALLRLHRHEADPRNWRPHILVFVRDPARHIGLVRLASWFNQDRGVVTACRLVEGSLYDGGLDTEAPLREMQTTISGAGLQAFCEVNVVSDLETGAIDVTQANGIAGLQSNTIVFGWPRDRESLVSQLRVLRAVERVGKSTVIARLAWKLEPGGEKRIDLWWGGLENNGDMMLLFAYLLSLNPEWDEARIVVRSVVSTEQEGEQMAESLTTLIPEVRIKADTEIILRGPDEQFADILHRHSAGASLVILGLTTPEPGDEPQYADRLAELAEGLPTTIFLRNAGEFAGSLV